MRISVADYCSQKKLTKLALKCGFFIFEGKGDTKAKDRKGKFITTILRHRRIKRETARGIIKALIRAGADIELRT